MIIILYLYMVLDWLKKVPGDTGYSHLLWTRQEQ